MWFTLTARWICGSREACRRAILEEKSLTYHVSIEVNLHRCRIIHLFIFLDYAKSADLRSISEFDGSNLIGAKERIRHLVTEWGRN